MNTTWISIVDDAMAGFQKKRAVKHVGRKELLKWYSDQLMMQVMLEKDFKKSSIRA